MARHKKEDPFFTSFKNFATIIEDTARLYSELLHCYPSETSTDLMSSISKLESQGDGVVRDIMDRLVTSFMTPFDREDISDLALSMDDILDQTEGAALRLALFNIQEVREEAVKMAEFTLEAAQALREMIDLIPNYQNDTTEIEKAARKLSKIENNGDKVYHKAIWRLFHEDAPSTDRLAWLHLFDRMEYCLDAYDRVATVGRRIVIKEA